MNKEGLSSFYLVIFKIVGSAEKTTIEKLQQMENLYLKTLKKKYNFLQKAYTSKGYTYTKESLVKITKSRLGPNLSVETKNKLRFLFSKEKNPFYGKKHTIQFKKSLTERHQGLNNPMFGKLKSVEFYYYAHKPKSGKNNYMSKGVQLVHVETKQMLVFSSQ